MDRGLGVVYGAVPLLSKAFSRFFIYRLAMSAVSSSSPSSSQIELAAATAATASSSGGVGGGATAPFVPVPHALYRFDFDRSPVPSSADAPPPPRAVEASEGDREATVRDVVYHWPSVREVSSGGMEVCEIGTRRAERRYCHVLPDPRGPNDPSSPFSLASMMHRNAKTVSVLASLEDASPALVDFCGGATALVSASSQWILQTRVVATHRDQRARYREEGGDGFERPYSHPWLKVVAEAAPAAFSRAVRGRAVRGAYLRFFCLDAHATSTYYRWRKPVCFMVIVDACSLDPISVGPPLTDVRFPVTSDMLALVLEAAVGSLVQTGPAVSASVIVKSEPGVERAPVPAETRAVPHIKQERTVVARPNLAHTPPPTPSPRTPNTTPDRTRRRLASAERVVSFACPSSSSSSSSSSPPSPPPAPRAVTTRTKRVLFLGGVSCWDRPLQSGVVGRGRPRSGARVKQ